MLLKIVAVFFLTAGVTTSAMAAGGSGSHSSGGGTGGVSAHGSNGSPGSSVGTISSNSSRTDSRSSLGATDHARGADRGDMNRRSKNRRSINDGESQNCNATLINRNTFGGNMGSANTEAQTSDCE